MQSNMLDSAGMISYGSNRIFMLPRRNPYRCTLMTCGLFLIKRLSSFWERIPVWKTRYHYFYLSSNFLLCFVLWHLLSGGVILYNYLCMRCQIQLTIWTSTLLYLNECKARFYHRIHRPGYCLNSNCNIYICLIITKIYPYIQIHYIIHATNFAIKCTFLPILLSTFLHYMQFTFAASMSCGMKPPA